MTKTPFKETRRQKRKRIAEQRPRTLTQEERSGSEYMAKLIATNVKTPQQLEVLLSNLPDQNQRDLVRREIEKLLTFEVAA